MVDERMRAAWGRTYTQDYIERSTQTLANIGNPDSVCRPRSTLTRWSNQALYKCRATWLTPRTSVCHLRKQELTSRSTLGGLRQRAVFWSPGVN